MRALRQLGGGLLYGLVSVVLVIGGLSLALAESYTAAHPTPTTSPSAMQPVTGASTESPLQVITPTTAAAPVPTTTIISQNLCQPPAGWVLITVLPDDSLGSLAIRFGTTPAQIEGANCLSSPTIYAGQGLFVPPVSSAPVPTIAACGPFPGWIRGYVVRPGDTLYHVSVLYRTTVADLERANCKPNPTIYVGEWLWVPNVPISTPGVTSIPDFGTPTPAPTQPLTLTPLPFTATVIPTSSGTP